MGLAAPQVVVGRVVVVDTGDGVLELVNPELVEFAGEQEGARAACICSWSAVKRPCSKVRAQDRDGDWFEAGGGRTDRPVLLPRTG